MFDIDGVRALELVRSFDYVRQAGTPGEKKAAQELSRILKDMGAEPLTEEFNLMLPVDEEIYLKTACEPSEDICIAAVGFCAQTPENGIEGEPVYVENMEEVSLRGAEGRIAVINAPATAAVCSKLEKAGALAFLVITGSVTDTGEALRPAKLFMKPEAPGSIPGASIHSIDAQRIIENNTRLRLCVRQKSVMAVSQNVAVRIEGSSIKDEIITVTAHYDSVPAGPGAYDNMAGAAIIMELCCYFLKNRPKRTMEFIWFGAEERGLLGSRAYVQAHENELDRHRLNMNVDLAGQFAGKTVVGVTADKSLCDLAMKVSEKTGIGVTTINNIWSSDSNVFAWKRIPALTLNRDGAGMHTAYDTAALISAWSLRRSAQYLCGFAQEAADQDVLPFSPQIPDTMLNRLDEAFADCI